MPKKAQAKKPKRFWLRRIAAGVGLFVLGVGGVAGWVVYSEISANLPPVDKLLQYQLPVATRVYAADGTLLGEFYTEKRYLVPIAKIPEVVRQAFIAAEDSSFYRHKGVDVLGIARAAMANFTAGSVVQGGSTITQQVVKSLLLSPEKSYERKLKEILLSLRLERQLTTDEILYLYLNLIYLGNGAYGVGAAAQEYFGKDVADLDLAEAALLAGLPQAPSRYSPVKHWDRAKYRQRYHEARPIFAAQAPILERQLERDLDRRRAGVRVEDAREPRGCDRREPGRDEDRRRAHETEQRRVRDAIELGPDGGVDRGVAMAVDVAPERRDAVEIAPALAVDQVVALRCRDHQRIGREPLLHLRERVPEMGVIQGDDLAAARLVHGGEA
jgi:penicillin-binding protein 1A